MSKRPENQFEIDIRIAEARVNRCQKALDEAITSSESARICINLCRAWSILAEKQRVYILNLQEKAGLWPNGMSEIEELAWDSQAEWSPVAQEHAPQWTHGYKRILGEIEFIKEMRNAEWKDSE